MRACTFCNILRGSLDGSSCEDLRKRSKYRTVLLQQFANKLTSCKRLAFQAFALTLSQPLILERSKIPLKYFNNTLFRY